MGTAPPSKPCSIPSRPFDKHGHRRSCLGAVIVLPRRRKTNASSTLMQLVLLRDWQRVLIRASLFPREVNKPGIVKLYGVHWKLLSLHLACALQPPPKVVSLLLSASASSTPVEQRKKIRIIPSWNFLSTSSPEDEKELLTTRDEYADLDDISIETTTTNHRGESWINNNNMSRLQGSLVSFEQSIGDWNSTASQTIGGTALDASLCSYLDKNDVVLQLTESGGVSPMHALQSKDTLSMSEETSLEFQEEPLIQAATETKTMLPIHIACLYQASPAVIQLLLQDYPMGALSAMMGMLPIHMVAVGWVLEPIKPQPIHSSMKIDDGTESNNTQALQVLVQALPESITAKSGYHGMTPLEYVEEHIMEGSKKQECLILLRTALAKSVVPSSHHAESCELTETIPSEIHCISSSDSSSGHLSVPTQSILYNLLLERSWQDAMNLIEKDPSQAREWHYGIENDTLTSDEGPSLWKRLALHLACSVAAPVGLIDLLIHIHPNAVGCCDPHTGSIPLHLACQFGASLEVIRTLIRARSTTTKAMDTQGKLPLHYAILSSSSYATIELLVHHDPATVLCPDQGGKTPLQYAQHSYPVGSPVIGLLELVWM